MLLRLIILSLFLSFAKAECPTESFEWQSKCFKIIQVKMMYFSAQMTCTRFGGNLVSIHDASSNTFLRQKLADESGETDFWIGASATDLLYPGKWSWKDGTALDFNMWKNGKPRNGTRNSCAVMSVNDGYWSSQDCLTNKFFVCSVATTPTTTYIQQSTPPSSTSSPYHNSEEGWIYFEPTNSCYGAKNYAIYANWTTSEIYCQNLDAHLPSIQSQEEFSFLKTLANLMVWEIQTGIFTIDFGRNWLTTDGSSSAYFLNFGSWCKDYPANISENSYVTVGNYADKDCYWNREFSYDLKTICKKKV